MSHQLHGNQWLGKGFSRLAALREPLHKLQDTFASFRRPGDDRAIFKTYIDDNPKWKSFAKSYYSNIGGVGAVLTDVLSRVYPNIDPLGMTFLTIGSGALIFMGLRSVLSESQADKAIDRRREYSEKEIHSNKAQRFEVVDYGAADLKYLKSTHYDAETALRILEVARRSKPLQKFYQECDRGHQMHRPESDILKYYAMESLGIQNYMNNVCRQAEAGKDAISHAISALERIPHSAVRTAQATHLMKFIAEFEKHTFMIPGKDDPNKSVWSELREMIRDRLQPMIAPSAIPQVAPVPVQKGIEGDYVAARPTLPRGRRP